MPDDESPTNSFDTIAVTKTLTEVAERVLNEEKEFRDSKVEHWSNEICKTSVERLAKLELPLKYIVTCIIMQQTGAGICTSMSCLWDKNDKVVQIKLDGVDSNRILCVVTAAGISI